MSELPNGWQQIPLENGYEILFKLFKSGSLEQTFAMVSAVSNTILDSEVADSISVMMSKDFTTITFSDVGKDVTFEQCVELAEKIDAEMPQPAVTEESDQTDDDSSDEHNEESESSDGDNNENHEDSSDNHEEY
jgi:hypothetical protein